MKLRKSWTFGKPILAKNQPPPLRPANPTLMEVDATRKKAELPDVCRRCGKPGHWAKDCPRKFDIRYMTLDEKEEWMQEEALQADAESLAEKQQEEKEMDFLESSE